MISDIKAKLLEDTSAIVDLLEIYGFEHINVRGNQEIRFARDAEGGQNISIRLQKNEWANVCDFARAVNTDIFSYIAQEKNCTFRDVLKTTKDILGLDSYWQPQKKNQLFGGIYSNIGKNYTITTKTYPEEILQDYTPCGNTLWLSDGITLEAMRFYDVSFSVVDNAIVFPWRNQYGEIIALKSRVNEKHPSDEMPKYYYIINDKIGTSNVSTSLFNYSQCYEYLYNADRVFVVESEKTCMKLWGWGIKNVVAVGCHSLSQEQIKLLLQLQCKEICFMFDSGLDLSETKKAADAVKEYARLRDIKLSYWNWEYNIDLDDKSAPVDGTYEQFKYILENEIEPIENLYKE